jgi:hypothetical protein
MLSPALSVRRAQRSVSTAARSRIHSGAGRWIEWSTRSGARRIRSDAEHIRTLVDMGLSHVAENGRR